MDIATALFLGFLLDLIIGDPYYPLHPIRLIGLLIKYGEKIIRKIFPKNKPGELIGGGLLSLTVMGISFAVPYFLMVWLGSVNIYLKIGVEALLCWQVLATKCLKTESMLVCKQFPDIESARYYLSRIVGRDTKSLDEKGIIKATVETVAENTTDGVIAPIIFMAIGGAPLGLLYKAVNTLDSMIGYKNEKYLYFGRVGARLDDLFNLIPAVFSAYVMMFSAFLLKLDFKNAVKIYRRDRYNHASPNSAKTESVCAGALNICLAGDAYYFGKLVRKPTIGDDNRPIKPDDISTVNKLMYLSATLAIIFCLTIRILGVCFFWN